MKKFWFAILITGCLVIALPLSAAKITAVKHRFKGALVFDLVFEVRH